MPAVKPEEFNFTYFDMIAFDIARVEAQKSDTRIPAWMCMSETAKAKYRQNALDFLNGQVPFHLDGGPQTEELCKEMLTPSNLRQWIDAETQLYNLRQENNPQAWFV